MLVEDLSFRQVTARVARIVLQSVAPHEGVGAGVGARSRVTQREIAEMAGTRREVVARALKALEDAGAIKIDRHGIRIADQEKAPRPVLTPRNKSYSGPAPRRRSLVSRVAARTKKERM